MKTWMKSAQRHPFPSLWKVKTHGHPVRMTTQWSRFPGMLPWFERLPSSPVFCPRRLLLLNLTWFMVRQVWWELQVSKQWDRKWSFFPKRSLTPEGTVTGFYIITPISYGFQPISVNILGITGQIQEVCSPWKWLVGPEEEETLQGSQLLLSCGAQLVPFTSHLISAPPL